MTCVLMLSNMWPWSGGFAQYVSWAEDDSPIPYMPPEPGGGKHQPSKSGPCHAPSAAQSLLLLTSRVWSSVQADWDVFQRYASKFYADGKAQQAFLAHVRFVLTRRNPLRGGTPYAEDPTVMAWELANEPRGMKQAAAYRAWVESTAGYIKSLAPHQLVTIGTHAGPRTLDSPCPCFF